MWMVDLTDETQTANAARPIEPINNVYPTGTIAKLVAFYHGCACSIPISSFQKILELGTVLPGITKKDILKYPPITAATAAGHLGGTRFIRFRPNCKLSSSTLMGSEGESLPFEKFRTPVSVPSSLSNSRSTMTSTWVTSLGNSPTNSG
jgi:hypothetical protein